MSMFWAGAMMALAPILFFGTLIGVLLYKRRKGDQRSGGSPVVDSGVPSHSSTQQPHTGS